MIHTRMKEIKKYVFVSYSHKDEAEVLEIIEKLTKNGLRVWYDNGINPGSNWPEVIAGHLNNCEVFLIVYLKKRRKLPQLPKGNKLRYIKEKIGNYGILRGNSPIARDGDAAFIHTVYRQNKAR